MSDFDRLPDNEPPSLGRLIAMFVVVATGILGALFCVIAYLAVA